MHRRFSLSLSSRILLAGLAGALVGTFLRIQPFGPWTVLREVGDLLAAVFLVAGWALAIPLIFSSVVLGAVGLEPMRALGKITRKTVVWMAGSGLAAVGVGAGAAYVLPLARSVNVVVELYPGHGLTVTDPLSPLERYPAAPWGWAALVLLSLGFAYYRNQIEEGHGRLITRFCQATDEMLTPAGKRLGRLAPWGVFALTITATSVQARHYDWERPIFNGDTLQALLLAWAVYGMVLLPAALWFFTRINPWTYAGTMLPAVMIAFASGSPEATLSATMHGVRRGAHVSNRVAGVVLSIGAVFQREGLALGCATVLACDWRARGSGHDWTFCVGVLLTCFLLSLGAGVLRTAGGVMVVLVAQTGLGSSGMLLGWGFGQFIVMGGAALSVWSHACAAAIIAKGEGEYWVPGPPPDADELQGLKSELELADG